MGNVWSATPPQGIDQTDKQPETLDDQLLASVVPLARVEIKLNSLQTEDPAYDVRLAVHNVCCRGTFVLSASDWHRLAEAIEQNQPFVPLRPTAPSLEIHDGMLRIRSVVTVEWPVALFGPALVAAIREAAPPLGATVVPK